MNAYCIILALIGLVQLCRCESTTPSPTTTTPSPTTTTTVPTTTTSTSSTTTTTVPQPQAVTNLAVSSVTTTSASLTWDELPGHTYEVFYDNKDDTGTTFNFHGSPSTNSYNVTGLRPGHMYEFKVRSVLNGLSSDNSTTTATLKPEAVTSLTVSSVTTSSASLTWNGKPEYTYEVFYDNKDDSEDTVTLHGSADTSSYNVTGLLPGNMYEFKVRSVRHGEKSSNMTVMDTLNPSRVTFDQSSTSMNDSFATIHWSPGTDSTQDGYRVRYTDHETNYDGGFNDLGNDITSHTFGSLNAGHNYTFFVKAYRNYNGGRRESEDAALSLVTIPPTPSGLRIWSKDTTTLSIDWTPPSSTSALWSYKVAYKELSDGSLSTVEESHTMTSIDIDNLTPGQLYEVQVATKSHGKISPVSTVQGNTNPLPPTSVAVVAKSTSVVTVSWQSAMGSVQESHAVSYEVGGSPIVAEGCTSSPCDIDVGTDKAGEQVRVMVSAKSGDGTSDPVIQTGNTKPASPGPLSISNRGTTSLTLLSPHPPGTWAETIVSTEPMLASSAIIVTTQGSNFLITLSDLTPGNFYAIHFGLKSGNELGENVTANFYTKPPTPSAVSRGETTTTTSLTVTWTQPSTGNFTSYILHINDADNTMKEIAHNAQERKVTFNSPALTPGTQYKISLKTELKDGSTVIHSESANVTYYTKPEKAVNIQVQSQTTSSVSVSWDVPTRGGFSKFQVSLKESAASSKEITIGNAYEATFGSLKAGAQYTVEIITYAGDQSSVTESALATTRPNAPTNLAVQTRWTTNITVTWNAPAEGGKENFLILIQPEGESDREFTVNSAVTSYTATNLQPGKQYTFQVFTVYKSVRSDGTSLSTKTAPNPIRNLRTTSKSTRDVTLQWDTPDQQMQVDGYHIKLTVVGTGNMHSENIVYDTTKTYNYLTPGEKYSLEVKSYVTDVYDRRFSSGVLKIEFTMVPNAPENVRIKNHGTTYIEVEWNDPYDSFTGFRISYKRTDTSVSFPNQNILKGTNSYQIENLEPGIEYVITIRTLSGVEQSSERSITHRTAPGGTQVKLEEVSENSITVSWTKPEQGFVSGYELRINPNDGNEVLPIAVNDISPLQYTFDVLRPGRPYSISVTVKAGDTPSSDATRSITTMPKPVNNLIRGEVGTDRVTLLWQIDSTSTQQKFVIEYAIGEGNPITTDVNGNSVTHQITSLRAGATYTIDIYAKTSDGVSSKRRQIDVTTKPLPVAEFTATVESASSITLRWKSDGNSEQDSYLIAYESIYQQTSWRPIEKQTGDDVVVNDLYPGDSYTFRILVKSKDQSSVEKYSTQITTYPLPPNVINVTNRTTSSLTIQWPYDQSLSHVDQWKISKTPSGQTLWEDEPPLSSGTTSHTLMGLTSGLKYTIRIHSISKGVSSTQPKTTDATVVPRITTSLKESVEETDTSTAVLTYTEEQTGNGVFDHYRFTIKNSEKAIIKQSSDEDRTVRFTELVAGTLYDIEAVTVSGKIASSESKSLGIYTVPNPPTVKCKDETFDKITLEMAKPAGGADQYELQCNGDNCPDEPRYATAYQSVSSEVFSNLKPYTDYTFKIKSQVGDTKSSRTVEQRCQTGQKEPSAVRDLKVSDVLPYQVRISWREPSEKNGVITGYSLTFTGSKTGQPQHRDELVLNAMANQKVLEDLKAGYTYVFIVRAKTVRDGDINSVTATLPIYAPKIVLPAAESKPAPLGAANASAVDIQIVNPFDDKHGKVVYYDIIVSKIAEKPTQAALPSYSAALVSGAPQYVTIRKCRTLFSLGGATCDGRPTQRRRRDTAPANTTVRIGTDTDCNEKTNGFCNGPLEPETMYYFILRGYTETDNYTDTDPSDPIITAIAPTNLNLILAIVFGIIGALVVVAVIVIVVMVRRRGVCVKGTVRSTTSGDGTPLASVASDRRKKYVDISRPVKIAAFGEHCKRMAADSDLGYSEEYEDLKSVGRDQACSAADLPANRNKNRFTNILPYDHSRVKLLPTDDEDGSDYINANWMPGYNSKREFVVTQGPLPSTRDDFWRMVWEQNCRAIVMVTKCVEKGREKCDHYWPVDSEPMYYGDLRVLVLNETKCSDWVVSEFELSQGDQIRRLVHFHYTGWPDFGVPEKLQSLIRFVRLVRARVGPEGGPIVVHCSAGVGRSGTYITLDRIFQIVQDAPDQESTVDIYSIVNEMRRYRMYMVQTEQQYICVHDCLKCVIEGTENDDNLYANGNDNDGYEQDEGIEDN